MKSWLSKWFGKKALTPKVGTVAPPSQAKPVSTTFGVCRPLLDRDGRIAGFEFSLPTALAERTKVLAEQQAAPAAHAIALLTAMLPTLQAQRCALTALPLALLSRPSVLQQVPTGAMLALTDSPWDDPNAAASLAALRQHGVQLGSIGTPTSNGQFVLLDASNMDGAALSVAVATTRQAAPGVKIVATGIGSIDDLETALASGVNLAGGAIIRRGATHKPAPLPLRLKKISGLLNQVLRDIELPILANEIRADVGLSYQLLRHANSAWLGLSRAATSAEEAVMLMGRNELFRWLSLMLLAEADPRPTSQALQEIAMARGRLLETLAVSCGELPTPRFTVGLLSLLDMMLQTSMADALEPLHLPDEAVQALVDRTGPWYDTLALAIALETNDVETASRLALPYGGLERVTEVADAAWRWAREAKSSDNRKITKPRALTSANRQR